MSTDYPPESDQHSALPTERRQSLVDRRGNARSGKLDRRRNRCGHCCFYGDVSSNELLPPQATCQHHQKTVAAQDFGCVAFKLSY